MRLIALVVAAVACAPASRTEAGVHATPAHPATAQGHRAVLVSFDAMNEQRVMESVPRDVAPALHELFTTAVCADGARAAFPTLTAPGHAALWTGAFGNVTGIAANTQPRLPLDQFTLLQSVSGYFVDGMRAEPLWLTAARAGRSVVALHVTQAPRSPSYVPTLSRDSAASIARRTSAESLLAQPGVAVVNGYNTLFAPHTALTEQVAHPRPAMWKGASTLAGDRPPIEIAWKIADDSLFGLFFGRGRYTHVVINRSRDVSGGVIASADSVEREWPRDRPLARHFSEPLAIPVGGRTAFVYFRLFDVAPDVSHFLLYQSEVRVPESNTSSVGREYDAAVRGWLGGAASGASVRAFGRAIRDGGDGTAELRFLETAELETRQFMRSSVWGWDVRHPDLFVDYFPLADQLDHAFYGDIARDNPHFDSTRAARIQDIRLRGWSLVDRVVAAEVARAREPGTLVLVSGDHGMRPYWRVVHTNAILAAAGLLSADSAGRIDLAHTRAVSPNGYWVTVNDVTHGGGIVQLADRDAVIARADSALRAARDESGNPVVVRTWRAAPDDTLGLGGPAGGDLYFGVAPGLYYTQSAQPPFVTDVAPEGGHGFPSTDRDMRTVFCAVVPGVAAHRIPTARVIDAAPTIAEWLGMPAPSDSRGRSLLAALLGR